MFVKAYDVIDRDYYPARLAAAEFMLSRSNEEKAYELLSEANRANPRHPDIDRLMGRVMLKANKLDLVEACVDSLREVNPTSIEADVLEARLQLQQKQRKAAEATLTKIIARDPHRFDALGLLAGLQYATARDNDAIDTLHKADAIDANQSQAYLEAGEALFQLHQLRTSLLCLKTAVERAPWSVEARNALGNVYLQSGDDENARAALDAAYTVDPFNVATVNYLKLLDQTAKFLRTETDHFIFVYDTPDDPIVPLYIAPYMEQAYKEVTGPLHYEPPQKTIIQIYPDADTFSVRMSGVPGIESFAFTFGRLIVSAAPRAGQNVGTFNWARVIKHEFAHTCHLTMTDSRVPRWLTEGLAVMSEQVDFRFDWVPEELYKRASNGKLFKIAELDTVFIRPKGQHDGEMAYMSGFWISRYMIETAGPVSINKLLLAYKEGKTDEEAFKIATGQSIAEFEPKYFEWAKNQVAKWGYDKESAEKYKKAFEHGEAMMKAGKMDEAWSAFSEACSLQPMNHMPHRRLAAIAMRQKRPDDALTHLRWLIPLEFRDDRFAKSIAGLYQQLGDVPKATEFAELAVKTDPYDPVAHDLLGELYQKANNDLAAREIEVAALLRQRKTDAEKAKNAPPKAD
jgi:tetratricopeptide (TPR) repeat protein